MTEKNRIINYNYFHWGPFLYSSTLTTKEINSIKKLCSKKNNDYREHLAGIINHEHQIDCKKLFPIIVPYIQSYLNAYAEHYQGKLPGNRIELIQAWVNYMIKGESNPLHTHDDDLSFVLYTDVPKKLVKEFENHIGNTRPGLINFVYSLGSNKLSINEHSFIPKVGDIFIFPANLHHYVNTFRSDGERISVSGNITLKND